MKRTSARSPLTVELAVAPRGNREAEDRTGRVGPSNRRPENRRWNRELERADLQFSNLGVVSVPEHPAVGGTMLALSGKDRAAPVLVHAPAADRTGSRRPGRNSPRTRFQPGAALELRWRAPFQITKSWPPLYRPVGPGRPPRPPPDRPRAALEPPADPGEPPTHRPPGQDAGERGPASRSSTSAPSSPERWSASSCVPPRSPPCGAGRTTLSPISRRRCPSRCSRPRPPTPSTTTRNRRPRPIGRST